MKSKFITNILFTIMVLLLANNVSAQTVTSYDGEYATDITSFEYELTSVTDPGVGWLKFYWSFNTTGDKIRFELGTSVLSEDFVDVLYDSTYKIPMDIYINEVELDVNANATYFDYWETAFWNSMLLPIEDGQYNNFDVLEDQDPDSWDVKTDEVSFFTTQSELVYDYNTGILLTWVSTVSYEFSLVNTSPPGVETTTATVDATEEEEGGFADSLPISSLAVFSAVIAFTLIRKLTYSKRK